MNMSFMADTIIEGRRLKRDDEKALAAFGDCDPEELLDGADRIRARYCGDKVELCSIISGKGGQCTENCKFCAQSAKYDTGCKEFGLLPEEKMIEACLNDEKAGIDRFAVVTAGRMLNGQDFEDMLHAYGMMDRKSTIDLCASFGFLSDEQFRLLRIAGASTYHHNLETSRRFFPEICTTHGYDMKIRTLKAARNAGMRLCSGGIIGMGESWQDRVDLAVELSELKVDSIPINVLLPIKGTPLETRKPLEENEILRTIAMFRYINPTAQIRLAAGRALLSNNGEKAFKAGADAAISGDMLTTVSGVTIAKDREMLTSIGRTLRTLP